jgi:class 3 adenylate cyclase
MQSNGGNTTRLEMAHVLFMDVVGYTRLSLEQQHACIEELQALVRGTPTFQAAEQDESLLSHPSGDGMALAFFDDPTAPARCALEIADRMRGPQRIELRMGVHSGPITRGQDINGMPNVRGQAINMANRVMDCGDAGHILVSRSAVEILSELSRWAEALVDLGEAKLKHGQRIGLYNLVDGDLGNPARPSRLPSAAPRPVDEAPTPSGMRVSDRAHVIAIAPCDEGHAPAVLEELERVAHRDASYQDAESHGAARADRAGGALVLVFFHGLVPAVRCGLDIGAAAVSAGLGDLRVGVCTGPIEAVSVGSTAAPANGRLIDKALAIMTVGRPGHATLTDEAATAIADDTSWSPRLDDAGALALPGGANVRLFRLADDGLRGRRPEDVSAPASDAPNPPEAPVPTGTRVALLYRRNAQPDAVVLNVLEQHLRAAGHAVFIDRHMTVGIEWAQEIESQIRAADIVVALLSASSVHSEMLDYEVRVAHEAAQEQTGQPRILPIRIDYDGPLPPPMASVLDQLQQFLWTSADDNDRMVAEIVQAIDGPAQVSDVSTPVGGAVPIDSALYVVRPTDDLFHRAVSRKDSIVLVKGARQMGKTSLLARGLQQARDAGVQALFTDLQALSPAQVASPEEFFLAMAYSLAEQMDLDVFPEERWTDRLGPGVNFERYMRRVVLAEGDHVLWALDEVDRMFVTEYASEAFGLFRSWHNKRALDPDGPWSHLTLVIAYATEAHLFITDVNQSPFNVGTRLELADFDVAQIADLNRRHGAPLSATEVAAFARLVGGHPYLVQRGFQAFVQGGVPYATLEATAGDDDGPYGDHLRRILFLLAQNDERRAAVAALTRGSVDVDAETFYHLRTAGLLTGASMRDAQFRNGLYADYLGRHLR